MFPIHIRSCARAVVSALWATLLLAGCGGVDSGGTGAAISLGPITGFGSIIVNGVHFDETAAVIQDDEGATQTRDRLKLGVMTQIDASALSVAPGNQTAVANSIQIRSELIGAVGNVDPGAGSLTVLGETVLVTPATVFDANLPSGLAGIPRGAVVEVYGRYDAANRRYTATRIEAKPNATFHKLHGIVSAVDASAQTLTIGSQKIDYSHIPAGDLPNAAVGNLVRATLQPTAAAGVWFATGLSSGVSSLPDRPEVQLEGRISAWTSSRQFSVNGTRVDASAATFPAGEAGVVLGARVSVEGASSAGVLRAQLVRVEGDEDAGNSSFELRGAIEALNPPARSFMLRGVTVDYSGSVAYESGTAADLGVGRRVRVLGRLSSDGARIEAQTIAFESN